MFKINSSNPNYLAKIVALPELRPHPNADKLAIAVFAGQSIITSKDAKVGGLYVLFQLESKINEEFLSYINGFSDSSLNRDKTKKSFFNRPRVKTIKLRGLVSEGYLHPVEELNEWLKYKKIKFKITEEHLNTEFDTIGEVLFVEKYINPETLRHLNQNSKKQGKVKKESRLVDNQFRLSPDYRQLKREIHSINPDDCIELTSKWHGCNSVIAKLLTKRKLSFKEKFARLLGVKIDDKEYNLLYSSRRVLKSEEFRDNPAESFYDSNVWEIVGKRYQESLKDGISCFGEIVGFTPTGAGIQGLYDYSCEPNKCDFYVFRITYTSLSGDVYEFSLPQVIDYCNKYGLKHVPVFYIGKAKDKYPELDLNNHWHESFLNKLIEEYLEKDCIYCKNPGLPDEGIVLSKRIGGFEGLKLKSQKFLLKESESLDKGEVNLEDVEAINEEIAA